MQLESKDLRVGNAFLQKGSSFVEFATIGDLVRIHEGVIIAEPVRLTESLLTRLGLSEGNTGYYCIDGIVISVEGQVYFGEDEVWICNCYFVHTLQNLVKLLTNTELTLDNHGK